MTIGERKIIGERWWLNKMVRRVFSDGAFAKCVRVDVCGPPSGFICLYTLILEGTESHINATKKCSIEVEGAPKPIPRFKPTSGTLAWFDGGASDPARWIKVHISGKSKDRGYFCVSDPSKPADGNQFFEVHASRLHPITVEDFIATFPEGGAA